MKVVVVVVGTYKGVSQADLLYFSYSIELTLLLVHTSHIYFLPEKKKKIIMGWKAVGNETL